MKVMLHLKKFTIISCLMLFGLIIQAQDTTRSVTQILTEENESWYMQPWVWIAGGIALLLILIALFSGGKKRNNNSTRTDKVIITKTVTRETDVND